MIEIIGIRFKPVGKIYYFDPCGLDIQKGMHVIVETVRGIEYGTVVIGRKETNEKNVVQPLKKVIRIATPQDQKTFEANRIKQKKAVEVCNEKIRAHNLKMKLIDVEYTFDGGKILFYFTADGRVDFRELVLSLIHI